ncbi:MAG: 16S ribosomal RNA methyltransferase A, partial [Methanoregulaceae archaeon]|nr:16S ribosomal RNA methyltransferase A [Methanoregulaceae archaeon]
LPPFDIAVSTLPYSASSKITFRLLDSGFSEAILMYQLEFAKRMVAPVGTPDCGRLSVMVQTFCGVRICFELPPNVFRPRPQVRSAVVHLIPREPIFFVHDREMYADVVRALFTHRRKTVRNCLKTTDILGPGLVARMLTSLPEEVLSSRPEELYLEDFATISNIGSDEAARNAGP